MISRVSSLLVVVLILAATAHAQATAPTTVTAPSSPFVSDFEKHWTTAQGLAIAVADAMPAENYGFKPVPEEMSFGEQIMHIAQANYGYCAFLGDAKSPFVEPAKDAKVDKAEAIKQLTGSFDYCSVAFPKITDAQLDAMHGTGDHKFASRDIMLGVMIHMVHHRGQAEVYLRLKGIKPPEYTW